MKEEGPEDGRVIPLARTNLLAPKLRRSCHVFHHVAQVGQSGLVVW